MNSCVSEDYSLAWVLLLTMTVDKQVDLEKADLGPVQVYVGVVETKIGSQTKLSRTSALQG